MILFPEHAVSYKSGIRQACKDLDQHQPETMTAKRQRFLGYANEAKTGSAQEAYFRGYAAELEAYIALHGDESGYPQRTA